MPMKKKIYVLIAAALLWTGCEKEIPLDTDGIVPKPVAMGIVEEGDTLSVRLTYSRLIYGWHDGDEENRFTPIDNAAVGLTVNGVAQGVVTVNDSGTYVTGYVPQVGDKIDMKVTVPGHEVLTASTVVPKKPVLSGLRVIEGATGDWTTSYDIRFTLADPAGEDNYYVVRVYQFDTAVFSYTDVNGNEVFDTMDSGPEMMLFGCSDAAISSFSVTEVDIEGSVDASMTELYFTDENLDGEHHEIHLTGNGSIYGDDSGLDLHKYIEVEVVALSRDRFLYEQSVEMARGDGDDFFQEPTQVHCNVTNGIGIFAALSRARIKTKVIGN